MILYSKSAPWANVLTKSELFIRSKHRPFSTVPWVSNSFMVRYFMCQICCISFETYAVSSETFLFLHIICCMWYAANDTTKFSEVFLFEFCINIAFSSGWLSAVKAKSICFSKAHEYTVCPLYEIFMPHCAYDSGECFKIVGIIECRSSRNRFKTL